MTTSTVTESVLYLVFHCHKGWMCTRMPYIVCISLSFYGQCGTPHFMAFWKYSLSTLALTHTHTWASSTQQPIHRSAETNTLHYFNVLPRLLNSSRHRCPTVSHLEQIAEHRQSAAFQIKLVGRSVVRSFFWATIKRICKFQQFPFIHTHTHLPMRNANYTYVGLWVTIRRCRHKFDNSGNRLQTNKNEENKTKDINKLTHSTHPSELCACAPWQMANVCPNPLYSRPNLLDCYL